MKLKNVKIYSSVKITKIENLNKNIVNRLGDLGVKEGETVTVIRKLSGGACMIIVVNGRLVAISEEIAANINCLAITKSGD